MHTAAPTLAFGSKWATFLACLVGVLAGFDDAAALAIPQQIFLEPARLLLGAASAPARFDLTLALAFLLWLSGFSLLRAGWRRR